MNNVAVSVRTTEYWISYENARYLSETNPFTYYSNTHAHMHTCTHARFSILAMYP